MTERKHTFKVPEGKRITSKEVDEDKVVFHLADEYIPEDGDVCYVRFEDEVDIFIHKKDGDKLFTFYVDYSIRGEGEDMCKGGRFAMIDDNDAPFVEFRKATDEEREKLLKYIAESYGETFNFKTKQFEPIRWKAEKGGTYETIRIKCEGAVIKTFVETHAPEDYMSCKSGNYYNPADHDKTADKVKRINEILKE